MKNWLNLAGKSQSPGSRDVQDRGNPLRELGADPYRGDPSPGHAEEFFANFSLLLRTMMQGHNCARQYTNDDWTFSFFLGTRADGGGLDGAGEIRRGGVILGRIVSQLQTSDREEMLESLMQACTAWVDDWKRRSRAAETMPADL